MSVNTVSQICKHFHTDKKEHQLFFRQAQTGVCTCLCLSENVKCFLEANVFMQYDNEVK